MSSSNPLNPVNKNNQSQDGKIKHKVSREAFGKNKGRKDKWEAAYPTAFWTSFPYGAR